MGLTRIIIFTFAAASIISMASAMRGFATYYNPPYVASRCYGSQDRGVLIAAANPAMFNNGTICGRRYVLRCIGAGYPGVPQPCLPGPMTVTIVDLCFGCSSNQIDLSREVFQGIALLQAGIIERQKQRKLRLGSRF